VTAAHVDRLFEPITVESPERYYAELRDHDPVHRVEGTNTYLVARAELIQEVVADPSTFSSRTGEFLYLDEAGRVGMRSPVASAGTGADEATFAVLATADPPDHGRQRKVLSRVLSTGAMKAREAGYRELVDAALDAPIRARRVEWMSEIAEPLPAVMVARLLGLPDETSPQLKEQGYAAVEQIGGFVPDDRAAVLEQKMTELGPIFDGFAAVRDLAEPDTTTAIGACAHAVANGELDEFEAIMTLSLLMAAGGESTSSLLGTGARLLAEDPELQDRLRAEPKLLPAFVEEACRIAPPFRGLYRRVVTKTVLGGVHLDADSRLVLLWPAANNDPNVCPHPDAIDIDRPDPRHHLGFGWGSHLCIGAPLARLEARVTFERLLARTRSVELEDSRADLRHHRSLMVRRLVELPLVLHG
jgi:cytochrome P450